jgi:hypothetical protein
MMLLLSLSLAISSVISLLLQVQAVLPFVVVVHEVISTMLVIVMATKLLFGPCLLSGHRRPPHYRIHRDEMIRTTTLKARDTTTTIFLTRAVMVMPVSLWVLTSLHPEVLLSSSTLILTVTENFLDILRRRLLLLLLLLGLLVRRRYCKRS